MILRTVTASSSLPLLVHADGASMGFRSMEYGISKKFAEEILHQQREQQRQLAKKSMT